MSLIMLCVIKTEHCNVVDYLIKAAKLNKRIGLQCLFLQQKEVPSSENKHGDTVLL